MKELFQIKISLMKPITFIAFMLLSAGVYFTSLSSNLPAPKTYYVSPVGDDSRSATDAQNISTPWKTIQKGWAVLVPGDVLYMLDGKFNGASQINLPTKTGSASSLITVTNYPGAHPVLDYSATTDHSAKTGVQINGSSFVRFKGLRITGITQYNSSANYGMILSNCHDMIIENCEFDGIGGYGFAIDKSHDNLILNCDAHHNADPLSTDKYGGSNGFGITNQGANTSKGNIFRYCRAWWNSDDGFDTFLTVDNETFDGCWSFWNGYIPGTFTAAGNGDGFKMGQSPVLISANSRTYKNCLAFENRFIGFDQNFTDASHMFPATFYNNTAFGNKSMGFFFSLPAASIFKNNLSYKNSGNQANISSSATSDHNSWNSSVTVSDADFVSVSSVGADGPRQADGSLPVITFMKLASNSDLIDKGVNVGIPYNGSFPDLGAFETLGTGGIPLPVTLNQLSSQLVGSSSFTLTWKVEGTSIETISLQKSYDGSAFNYLEDIPVSGSKSYTRETPVTFYRVRVVSGQQISYSNVVSIPAIQTDVTVSQISGYAVVKSNAAGTFSLTDMTGRTVKRGYVRVGTTYIYLGLPKGIYALQVSTRKGVFTFKIIV